MSEHKTAGELADEAAFEEMLAAWYDEEPTPAEYAMNEGQQEQAAMRHAWAAAIKRGVSLRGCCEDKP